MNKIQALIGGIALVAAGAASAQADWHIASPGMSSNTYGNTCSAAESWRPRFHSNGAGALIALNDALIVPLYCTRTHILLNGALILPNGQNILLNHAPSRAARWWSGRRAKLRTFPAGGEGDGDRFRL